MYLPSNSWLRVVRPTLFAFLTLNPQAWRFLVSSPIQKNYYADQKHQQNRCNRTTYLLLGRLIDRCMVVQSVEGSLDGIGGWFQITVDLLNRLVSMQALSPAHLVFIDHLESPIASIAIDEGVDY